MPDIEEGQTTAAEPAPFHVELSEGDEPLASDDDEAGTEATETEAGDEEVSESAADAAEDEKPTPPTAEELGLDLKLPKDKAAYAELVKKWGQWTNKFTAKHKQQQAEPAPVPQPEAKQAETPAAEGGEWDPYTVPLDKFQPDLKFREGSELADFKDELSELMAESNRQAIKFALNEMRQNDARFREQQQVGTAQQQIAAFAEALQAHPEWDEKAQEVAEFAQGTRELAVRNPEKWIRAVESITGIKRNWRDEAESAAATEAVQRGQQNQRTATKLRSVITRPTRAVAPRPATETSWDAAVDAQMKKMGL